ncbi:MAG TPA: helix-turn-helix domain-containing protein [Vicinamibacterales bacterium]
MGDGSYTVEDLERLLGIRPRTVHYWSSEGLFEGPGAGRGTRYTDEHLAKLFLIQKLREEGRPIAEIKTAIKRLPRDAWTAVAQQAKAEPPKGEVNAKDLIAQWLSEGAGSDSASLSPWRGAPAVWEALPRALSVSRSDAQLRPWTRIPLAPDVELHVQEPLSPASHQLVRDLMALAQRPRRKDT